MKTYANIKLEASKLPVKVVAELLQGKDVSLIVSANENTTNEHAPEYAEKGVAVWIKESKFQ